VSNKSNTSSQIISLPKGGGALHGIGEKFSPDLHTGTGNFTVPIALPPGRNGFQPQLNLVYSTGNGNGPFGLGWSLSVPGVSRKTSKGIPVYHDANDVFILSGAEDLVPVPKAPEGAQRFRPRTEGLFALIDHFRTANDDYWEVRSKDGLVSRYGSKRPVGAPANWKDPAIISKPLEPRKIFAWKLTETCDPFGNVIIYDYEQDTGQEGPHQWDQPYLKRIHYVDYTDVGDPSNSIKFLVSVTFIYEDRPDQLSEYRAGFEIRTRRRCTRIEIRTHPGKDLLTRTYEFTYLDQLNHLPNLANILPLNGVSLLSQIRVVGHDKEQELEENRTEELPPLEFGYTRFEPNRRDFFPLTGPQLPPVSLAHPDFELVDLFGNGLQDIFEMNGVVRYWRNLGEGKFDLPRDMRDAPAGLRLADSGVQLVDADGDGRTDLLLTTPGLSGYFPLRFGGLWDRRSFQRYKAAPSFNLEDPEVKLVDLDGDGVTDAIRSSTRLECFFNDPKQGWNGTKWVERQSIEQFPNVNFSDTRVKWGDMSGDGMQDIVLVFDGSVDYWPNLGYGDWGKRIQMRNSPRFPEGYNPRRILLGDVDGDGLADIVYVDDTKVTLWINQSGNAWSDPIVIKGTPPVSDMDAVRLSDMLGSGISGVLWSADFNGLSRQHMFFLDFTGGTKPYLLNEMDNHIGAVTRVKYAPSTRFYVADQQKPETRWKTPLPFPVQVVARVEAIDELSNGKLTTQYRYHHGYWDGAEREFRGFGMVEQFDSEAFGAELPASAAGTVTYNFSTIDFPGTTSTFLRGINNKGQIVGQQRDANGVVHSLLTDTHAFNTFDPPGSASTSFPGTSFAIGINDNGEIVGGVKNNDNPGQQAYIKHGNAFSLYKDPNADPSGWTVFEGINNAGVRIGSYSDNTDTPHGIVQIGNATTLLEDHPNVPANAGTFVFDINNLGQMVGGYFDPVSDIQHGFFTDGNTFTTIDFPGSSTTWLNGINDLKQMVGAYFDDATQMWHGFLTDGNTFIVLDFPNVPGQHPGTFVTGIDNAGRIVGYYGDDLEHSNKAGIHGFLATPADNVALRTAGSRQHFSPPTCTKTWFHQGPVGDEFGEWEELDLSQEFWPNDPSLLQQKETINNFLRNIPDRRVRRDASRVLRGNVLRTELYALEGSDRSDRPYTVTESRYGLEEINPPSEGEQPMHIFFPHLLAQRTTQWERGDDPLTQFTFTRYTDDKGEFDPFGRPLAQTQIACPRGWRKLNDIPTEPYLATRTRTTYANPVDPDTYIFNRVARTTSFELKNDGQFTVEDLHGLPDDSPSLEIFGQSYSYYDGPAFQGLPLGQVGPFGTLVRTESLALTEKMLHEAYKSGKAILDPPEEPPYLARNGTPPWTAEYPVEFRGFVPVLGGYTFHPGGPDAQDAEGFFVQAERRSYDFQAPKANDKGRGLITIRRDPLERDTKIAYDNFELLPVNVTDPAQLVTQATYDYRVLQPLQVTDPNNNLSLFAFTPLGLLKENFIRGKLGEGDQEQPSVRLTYDFLAFQNSKRLDPQNPQPIFVHTVRRVHHDSESDVSLPERNDTIEHREYSDGLGRVLQTRTQAEDILFGDPVFGGAVIPSDQTDQAGTRADVIGRQQNPGDPPNVVVSGWQVYDNKGRVVEKYEPVYSIGYDYGQPSDAQFGQKIEMFYDPRGQVIRTLNPDGSEQRVIFGVPGSIAAPDVTTPDVYEPTPWEAYTYDADDNAGRTHPVAAASYRHCWDTPSSITIDALGRTVLAIERNRDPALPGAQLPPIVQIRTSSTYDIRGNLLTVTDALDRPAFTHTYDLANQKLRVENIDAGIRRTIFDAAGNTIEYRDSKGALCLHAYDVLNRPIRLWAGDGTGGAMTQREHLIYGDSVESGFTQAQARAANLLDQLYEHYDEAGRLTCERYDFKGNLLEKVRQVISDQNILSVFNPPPRDWQVQAFKVDWQPPNGGTLEDRAAALLDTLDYRTSSTYDALNRLKALRYPQDVAQTREELRPRYNQAGALEAIIFDGSPYVQHIAYNAKGQRVLIVYGNGVMTRYAYDARMFRLLRMRTESYKQPDSLTVRPAANVFQDFAYEYDLVGNILHLHDRTPDSGIPNTSLGTDALDRDFVYDAVYRLRSADGRECDRQPDMPWDDPPRCTDVTRTHPYLEQYQYDLIGNVLQLKHLANTTGFTRDFTLVSDGTVPEKPKNNRLKRLSVGTTTNYEYFYDDNGNMTGETSSRHFEWDHSDRIRVYRTQAGTAEPSGHAHYLYDSGAQRVKKLVRKQGGQVEVTTYIDGLFEYQSVVQGNSRQENNTLHVMDNKSRVALLRVGAAFSGDSTPPVKYHLGDHLGSSYVVVGGASANDSNFINREEYTPYGETSFGSFGRKRYRYSGKERDEESRLYYHGVRYYSPWLCRWTACDPLGTRAVTNLYHYVHGNPLRAVDPSGMDDAPPPGWTYGEGGNGTINGTIGPSLGGTISGRPDTIDGGSSAAQEQQAFEDPSSNLGWSPGQDEHAPASTHTNLLPGGGAGGTDIPPQTEWQNPEWGEGTGPVIEGFVEGVKDRLIDESKTAIPDVPIVKPAAENALDDFKKPLPEGGGGTSVLGWFTGYVVTGVGIALAGRAITKTPSTRPGPESSVGAWRRWRYETSPKHGPQKMGRVGAAPKNGQAALDNATPVKGGDMKRLVGVDPGTGEFVVFDETHIGQGIYHGHVRTWDELTDDMRRSLIESGFVDHRGRILIH
jgi:RHS repeat-associated protein